MSALTRRKKRIELQIGRRHFPISTDYYLRHVRCGALDQLVLCSSTGGKKKSPQFWSVLEVFAWFIWGVHVRLHYYFLVPIFMGCHSMFTLDPVFRFSSLS